MKTENIFTNINLTTNNIINMIINNKIYNINNLPKQIISIDDLIKYYKINDGYLNYFIIYDTKIISENTELYKLIDNTDTTTKFIKLELVERQNGGSIIDAFKSIISIGELFMMLGDGVIWFGKFVFWLLKFIKWFFFDFLNPITLLNDFFESLMLIVVSLCRLPLDVLLALVGLAANTIGSWVQGFWGWDMSNLSKTDKDSNYFKSFDRTKGQKSYVSSSNTVPFSIILGTILCPPMGVFMDLGMTGWFNILICILLTLLFYIPGLCYALLIIYS